MKAFLSHSSKDKAIVTRVYEGLSKEATWLDSAEIEWGNVFLEKIEEGIEQATDFVLFWSADSAKSEWVRLELNMVFIRHMSARAVRVRVIKLDKTPLRLLLKPYQFLDVSDESNKAGVIVQKLAEALKSPTEALRHRFLNRHNELGQIELAIDNPEIGGIVLHGFAGIGKRSLAREAVKRFFEDADSVIIDVSAGTDMVEFVLRLNAASRGADLPRNPEASVLEKEMRLSIESVAQARRPLMITNVQHWLDDSSAPNNILVLLLRIVKDLRHFRDVPLMLTSTRRVALEIGQSQNFHAIHIRDLADQHMATLIRIWYRASESAEISVEEAELVAKHLHGLPIAAKLAAGIVGQYGTAYLAEAPHPFVRLRYDIARSLLATVSLTPAAEKILQCLSLIRSPVPASVLFAATGLNEEAFHAAIDEVSRLDFVEMNMFISVHPILADYYWYVYWRQDNYKDVAFRAALAIEAHLMKLKIGEVAFADLLPVAVRLFALGGDVERARGIRSDLLGEILEAAIQLYNRRDYELAKRYLQHILDADRGHWRARLYWGRILVREEKWKEASQIFEVLVRERPTDKAARHAHGWLFLRQRKYAEALAIFLDIVRDSDYVRALRDAADCLHMLGRSHEALALLARAKSVESENPYVLDLEARILEDLGELTRAYEAAKLASIRNPRDWAFQHRVGRILQELGRVSESIEYFQRATELEPRQFTPRSTLISAMLEIKRSCSAEIEILRPLAQSQAERSIVTNLEARNALLAGDYNTVVTLLEKEISEGRNLLPNLGVLAQALLERHSRQKTEYPATAAETLGKARTVIERGLTLEPNNEILRHLLGQIEAAN